MLDHKLLEQFTKVAAQAAYSSSLLKGKGDKIAAAILSPFPFNNEEE